MNPVLILAGDTVSVRSMIMSLQAEGFESQRISNGDELINRFTAGTPVAIFCDLAAPWPALSPLLRRIRAQGSGKKYRLLLFGERPPEATDSVLQALGLVEDDLFPEPVDMARLARRLREAPTEPVLSARNRPNLGFPPRGRLENVFLARILALLAAGRATGQLEVDAPSGLVTLSFKDGDLSGVLVPTGPFALAEMLVARGRLTDDARQNIARQGPITFEALVTHGVVGPHEIGDVAREQAELVVRDAMALKSGGYRWNEGISPRSGAFSLKIPLNRLILDGFKRSGGGLPPEVGELTPVLQPAQRELLQNVGLLPYELRAVNQLNGSRTVRAIIDEVAGSSDQRRNEITGLMAALHAIGLIAVPATQEEVVDWDVRRAQFEAELERMSKADPFEVLGTTSKTPVAEVRTRFFTLSKQYHPDRAFDAPPAVKDLMENIFRKVQEAYEVASDPKRREEYLNSKDQDKAGIDARAIVQSEIAFSQGELYLKNRNFVKAREFFEEAIRLNSYSVEFKAFLGWATFLADPEQFHEAARLIHEAIKANPNLDKAYFFMGSIFKARNEMSQAENAFRKAVAANPNNIDAQRELRLLNIRTGKPAGASSSPSSKDKSGDSARKGFFGGLFKKS